MLKNVTITLTEEAALWARVAAAKANTSVSRLLGQMLEEKMRQTDEYVAAYERLDQLRDVLDMDAANRLTREEAHERHR